ncbi:MAG: Asp/Glu racemase [Fibrobacteria bacterium]|nr:Asp/Glu racemase [Fibrobacteria bacterium]
MKKKLALIHTVPWYYNAINKPFAEPFLEANPDVEIINIMDDSLLTEALDNQGPTLNIIRRMVLYYEAAAATGADLLMCSCTTMGPGTRAARELIDKPIMNIDEPMAKEAAAIGGKLGVFATVPTSAPATRELLRLESQASGKAIEIKTVICQEAFTKLQNGDVAGHDEMVIGELQKLEKEVDVIVLGQISLAQVTFDSKVPVLQVGHSGFAAAGELLKA